MHAFFQCVTQDILQDQTGVRLVLRAFHDLQIVWVIDIQFIYLKISNVT